MKDQKFPSKPIGKTELPDTPITNKINENVDATCTFQGSIYSKGSVICINKIKHKCGNYGWYSLNRSC